MLDNALSGPGLGINLVYRGDLVDGLLTLDRLDSNLRLELIAIIPLPFKNPSG